MLLRVGLTGGIASGKSVVGREFERLGCHLIEADKLGHAVLLKGAEAYDATVAEFGDEILDPDTLEIDRKKLGAVVFHAPERLAALNAIVHPAVARRAATLMAAMTSGIVIYEAAILVETGGYRDFDRLVVAACPEELQIERALARGGLTREAVMERMQRQLPLADKIRYADYVVDTSGSIEETLAQTQNIYQLLIV